MRSKIARAKPGLCRVVCECGYKSVTALIPGHNIVMIVCDGCNGNLHIEVDYDGFGLALIKSGTIERVVADPLSALP